jgi:hypothetical protein
MKKRISLIAIMLISICSITAQDKKVLDRIATIDFSDELIREKMEIYNSMKLDSIQPTVLGGVIGFGIGSFAQHDNTYGGIELSMDIIGLGGTIAGIYFRFYDITNHETSYTILGIGVSSLLISKILQLTRPSVYASKYNSILWDGIFR